MTHTNQPLIPAFFTRTVAVLLAILLPPTGLAGEVLYVHTDHLGSPAVYTNAQGEVVAQEFSTPYGRSLNAATPNDTTNDTVSYTGHYRDGDTGLIYMQARYYDPVIGRFLSVDPVTFSPGKPEHFNRYWYANGNPLNNIDPDGNEVVWANNPNASMTKSELKDKAKAAIKASAQLTSAYKQLRSSKHTWTIKPIPKVVGSHVEPDSRALGELQQNGEPNVGTGGEIKLCLCGESVPEVGGLSDGETIAHEFKHATDFDAGIGAGSDPVPPVGNPAEEQRAIDAENEYRQEQDIDGTRVRH